MPRTERSDERWYSHGNWVACGDEPLFQTWIPANAATAADAYNAVLGRALAAEARIKAVEKLRVGVLINVEAGQRVSGHAVLKALNEALGPVGDTQEAK